MLETLAAIKLIVPSVLTKAIEAGAKAWQTAGEAQNRKELAVRVWGSILFEMRRNCERARYGAVKHHWGVFSFDVSDALMPEFCKLVPQPITLDQMQSVLAGLKRVDFFQRAVGNELADLETITPKMSAATGFAQDFIKKHHLQRFNLMLGLARDLGAVVFGPDWETQEPGQLPDPIDPNAEIDESLI